MNEQRAQSITVVWCSEKQLSGIVSFATFRYTVEEMSNTHSQYLHLLRALAGSVLVAGIGLVMSATSAIYTADLIAEQGMTIFDRSVISHELTLESPAGHAAAYVLEARPDLQARLVVGMLLVLLGFTLYTFWIVRMRPLRQSVRRR